MNHTPESDQIQQQAIAWVVRVGDPDFTGWADFTAWLEQSPVHADAYHAAAFAEAEAVTVLANQPRAIPVEMSARRSAFGRWALWAGTALAASLVAAIGLHSQFAAIPPHIYETAPGVQRTVALADGSRVVMNGGTRLIVDGRNPRTLSLARGEALFSVRHDEAHPFSVSVGGADVVDIGTRFDIVREGDATRVAVSEGAIDWRRDGNAVRVTAGRSLHVRDGSGDVALAPVMASAVGGWQQGQLEYDGTTVAEVAADLARTLGVTVSVDRVIETRPVRGVIRLDGGAVAVMPRLAALLGVRARQDGARWQLLASP